MYCPACGEQIPESSKFCLHCGAVIAESSKGLTDVSVTKAEERTKILSRTTRWLVLIIGLALIALIVSIWFGSIGPKSQKFPPSQETISPSQEIATSPKTVSPTESATPTQLSTTQFVTSTYQPYLLEDHFDKQRFDGSYNDLFWNCSGCPPELVFQKDGVLQIRVGSSPEDTGPDLGSRNSWNSTVIGYIEAKMKLHDYKGTGHADVNTQLWADLKDYQWWISCDVVIETDLPNKGYFRCHDGRLFPDGSVTGDYDTPSIPINPDEWQLARIEIEPKTFRLNFSLNGEIIGTMIPAEADRLKTKSLTPVFGTWTVGTSTFTAYLDDLVVAPQSARTP